MTIGGEYESTRLADLFVDVLGLQQQWEWRNTPEMEQRGDLVRRFIPGALLPLVERHRPGEAWAVEGSDGQGRKARIPWVRIFQEDRSPSATHGWYLVYLFAADGSRVHLSLNQGTTDPTTGYRGRGRRYLAERVAWARDLLDDLLLRSGFEQMEPDLADNGQLAQGYASGSVAVRSYDLVDLPGNADLEDDLAYGMELLRVLYDADARFDELPRGYRPGEALYLFSEPRPFTNEAVDTARPVPGTHVVWAPDGTLLYAGATRRQRARLREHLRGDRTSSILHAKVGRRLDVDLGREASSDEIAEYLGRSSVAWVELPTGDEAEALKARIMDELRPALNDVRPRTGRSAKVLAVYVGRDAARNLDFGLETRLWGFPADRADHRAVEEGDWLVLGCRAQGAAIRSELSRWTTATLERLYLARITRPVYRDDRPHWPDEFTGVGKYPFRIGFELVANHADVDLGNDAFIGPDVVDALRRSSMARGTGVLAEAQGRLFDLGGADGGGQTGDAIEPDLAAACRSFAAALTEANLTFGARHDAFVRTFVASLATKGFVLCTGIAGSGKSEIGKAFGQWLGEDRCLVVPVRPDWTGPEPLLGHEDALLEVDGGRRAWVVPEALRFMLRAARDPGHPYLLALDEMNLAHVERYFADALSGMESRTPVLPNLVEDNGWWRLRAGGPRLIPLPRNLFVIGTVNVDETTYMFSPKVLDRGNTIEFRVATDDLRVDALKPTPVTPGEALLVKGFLAAATDDNFQVAQPSSNRDEVAEKLRDLHRALSRYGFEWAHRTFYEMLRYAALLEACGETDQWAALDQQVKQKVLPHFHGSAQRLTRPLAVVARFCFDLGIDDEHEAGSFVVGDVSTDAALPQSFDKVRRMTGTLLENHFTGFAE